MKYSKSKIENGKLVTYDTVEVDQGQLTSDCWLIQFNGLQSCTDCDVKDTDECGGGDTLKKLKENANV